MNLICVAKYVPVPNAPKIYGAVTVPEQIYARDLHEKGKLQILNIACYTVGKSRLEQGKEIKFNTFFYYSQHEQIPRWYGFGLNIYTYIPYLPSKIDRGALLGGCGPLLAPR